MEANSKKKESLQVELHSNEVHEILSYIPHWIIRWGIALILGTVALILVGTWFIKYPELVPAQVTITSENPPRQIIARSSGNINLLVENGSTVNKNQELGYIETSTNFEDITQLKKYIAGLNQFSDSSEYISELSNGDTLRNLNLGELQPAFETFSQQAKLLLQFEEIDFHQKRTNQISERINNYQLLNKNLRDQKEISEEIYKISAKKMAMDSALFQKDAISENELDDARLLLLQNKRSIENADAAILNNQLRINELKNQIAELKLEYMQERQKLKRSFSKSLELLKSSIATWKDQYVLKAPISGVVTFFEIWSDDQYVNSGDEVMSVVPQQDKLFGLLRMPVARSGKVKMGQKINIRLSNYPYQRYGMLVGEVEQLSLVPKEGTYLIYISLPNGLETTYGNTLKFRQEMQGSAEIITEDLRLLERIFYQFRDVFGRI